MMWHCTYANVANLAFVALLVGYPALRVLC